MESDAISRQQLDDLFDEMIVYDKGDPMRIQHFTKVHEYARLIGIQEGLDETTLFILEAAAYTHDVGIHVAKKKYGKCDGALQEKEGPTIAQRMLSELGFDNYVIERICYLIGHHHTYDNIDGADYRILVEADFLVNLYEEEASERTIKKAYENIFRTKSGRRLCRMMFGLEGQDDE